MVTKNKRKSDLFIHQMQYEGNKNIQFLFLLKKMFRFIKLIQRQRNVKIKGGQMASQFCKFQEILFRKVVAIEEYYYQLK
jgi:hypothetical protein